ncbi:hypothetical protein BDF14DRAFT_1895813 [Spinellus fusiger]|nr:hypothetical protein BDF14DRAFT_1895813 [Spinellus fusiger]
MPLLALATLNTRLSSPFYPYGKACASRTFLVLLFSLSAVCFLSYPVVVAFYNSLGHDTSNTSIDQIDAQFWHFSPHLQPGNQSLGSSTFLVAQQIRITNSERAINHALLKSALSVQNALTTSFVHVDGKPASLATVCLGYRGYCVVHSPLEYWESRSTKIEQDKDIIGTINKQRDTVSDTTGLSLHPLSVFGNVTLDNRGYFVSADSIVLTVLLHQTPHINTNKIWDTLWRDITTELKISSINDDHFSIEGIGWQRHLSPITAETIQYMFKVFPYDLPVEIYTTSAAYVAVFLVVTFTFAKAQLVRSNFGLGFAAVFTAIASHMCSLGVLNRIGWEPKLVHTSLFSLVTIVSTLENVFLLTNAVLIAGCDMLVKEKIGRGLQSVGVSMMTTLLAELSILMIGYSTRIAVVREFCILSGIALIIENALQMTFFVAVLAIDVKRAELADLGDREVSKRLRELAQYEPIADSTDYCPVQDADINGESKTCAECKEFKTHRVLCALILCLSILVLALFRSQLQPIPVITTNRPIDSTHSDLMLISSRFWDLVNPRHVTEWLHIKAPYLIVFTSDHYQGLSDLNHYEAYYEAKANMLQEAYALCPDVQPHIAYYGLQALHQLLLFIILLINVPSLILCLVLVGIIMWMMPSWREQVLLPLLKTAFVNITSRLLFTMAPFLPWRSALIRRIAQQWSDEYTTDGIHLGAISAQEQFNRLRNNNIKRVIVKTLSGKHVADVVKLDSSSRHNKLVSCSQDGSIVVWDTYAANWMARLDTVHQSPIGATGHMNSAYQTQFMRARFTKTLSSARCVKLDQGDRWVAAGFEDGAVRVWNIGTGQLVRELTFSAKISVTVEDTSANLHHRFKKDVEPAVVVEPRKAPKHVQDRVLAIEFLSTMGDHHPLQLAQSMAANTGTDTTNTEASERISQNQILAVYKSGVLREWDIFSGECLQTIPTQHKKDITVLHVANSRLLHCKVGLTWILTGSKDGKVQCWQRKAVKTPGENPEAYVYTWTSLYTLEHGGQSVTVIASDILANNISILVTGTHDGAVKVWDLETGNALCTLSSGGIKRKPLQVPIGGGPLLKFSNLNMVETRAMLLEASSAQHATNKTLIVPDHQGSITQVAITPISHTQMTLDACRGCDTCYSNGFIVASASVDNTVHVWRLEHYEHASKLSDTSSTSCSKDHHRKIYRRPVAAAAAAVAAAVATAKTGIEDTLDRKESPIAVSNARNPRVFQHRPSQRPGLDTHTSMTKSVEDVLDIEQLGERGRLQITPVFLGEIEQLAGRSLVFCDNMVLAGVRQCKDLPTMSWEIWFASLQAFEPIPKHTISVEVFSMEDPAVQEPSSLFNTITETTLQQTPPSRPNVAPFAPRKHILPRRRHHARNIPEISSENEELEDEQEAKELLPFSAVRHLIPLEGQGFACDFGNFIKIVRFEERFRPTETVLPSLSTMKPLRTVSKTSYLPCDGDCAPCGGAIDGKRLVKPSN